MPIFYSYFKGSFSGEYHMYHVIPLYLCNYFNKVSVEIGIAVQNWL